MCNDIYNKTGIDGFKDINDTLEENVSKMYNEANDYWKSGNINNLSKLNNSMPISEVFMEVPKYYAVNAKNFKILTTLIREN